MRESLSITKISLLQDVRQFFSIILEAKKMLRNILSIYSDEKSCNMLIEYNINKGDNIQHI